MKQMSGLSALSFSFLFILTQHALAVPGRDPTQPAFFTGVSNTVEKSSYDLQSIMIGKGAPLALINDKFVTIGDMIDNAKVIAIRRNSVILDDSNQKVTLYLFDSSIQEESQ